MDETKKLKIWLEGFITHTEKKISHMERVVPDHRNIMWFKGQVHMAKKTLQYLDNEDNGQEQKDT